MSNFCEASTKIIEKHSSDPPLKLPSIETEKDPKQKVSYPTNGHLVIAGGRKLDPDAFIKLIELLGGAEKVKLVIIPTASASYEANREEADARLLIPWVTQGVNREKQIIIHHPKNEEEARSEAFAKVLKTANCVWFSGGAQCLLMPFVNSPFEQELKEVLKRGGVVGGISAGAAIMSEKMIVDQTKDGTPILGTGFSFLENSLIDQHFSQKERYPRLEKVLKENPERMGIGVDEGTALFINLSNLHSPDQNWNSRVIGDNHVHFISLAGNNVLNIPVDEKRGQVKVNLRTKDLKLEHKND